MRRLFRAYLDTRLRIYQKLPDLQAAEQELAHAEKIQQEIWSRAVAASHDDESQNTARLLLPALNEMIDITTARTIALHTHLPPLIFALLMSVALLSGVLAGYEAEVVEQRHSRRRANHDGATGSFGRVIQHSMARISSFYHASATTPLANHSNFFNTYRPFHKRPGLFVKWRF